MLKLFGVLAYKGEVLLFAFHNIAYTFINQVNTEYGQYQAKQAGKLTENINDDGKSKQQDSLLAMEFGKIIIRCQNKRQEAENAYIGKACKELAGRRTDGSVCPLNGGRLAAGIS